MRLLKLVVLYAVTGIGSLYGMTQQARVHLFAAAVARTEGFYIPGSIPSRLHNPGDICTRVRDAYPGQRGVYRGYAVFKTDAWGWAALESQIQRMLDGASKRYDQSMTIIQFARVYAENWRYWGTTVSKILGVTPQTTVEEFFGVPPRVRMVRDELPMWLFPRRDSLSGVQPLPEMSS